MSCLVYYYLLRVPYLRSSDVLHVLRVEEGEAHELGLVEVHHEQLVRGGQLRLLLGESLVEVRHVLAMFLGRK